jgi:hypothetical protein
MSLVHTGQVTNQTRDNTRKRAGISSELSDLKTIFSSDNLRKINYRMKPHSSHDHVPDYKLNQKVMHWIRDTTLTRSQELEGDLDRDTAREMKQGRPLVLYSERSCLPTGCVQREGCNCLYTPLHTTHRIGSTPPHSPPFGKTKRVKVGKKS